VPAQLLAQQAVRHCQPLLQHTEHVIFTGKSYDFTALQILAADKSAQQHNQYLNFIGKSYDYTELEVVAADKSAQHHHPQHGVLI